MGCKKCQRRRHKAHHKKQDSLPSSPPTIKIKKVKHSSKKCNCCEKCKCNKHADNKEYVCHCGCKKCKCGPKKVK